MSSIDLKSIIEEFRPYYERKKRHRRLPADDILKKKIQCLNCDALCDINKRCTSTKMIVEKMTACGLFQFIETSNVKEPPGVAKEDMIDSVVPTRQDSNVNLKSDRDGKPSTIVGNRSQFHPLSIIPQMIREHCDMFEEQAADLERIEQDMDNPLKWKLDDELYSMTDVDSITDECMKQQSLGRAPSSFRNS